MYSIKVLLAKVCPRFSRLEHEEKSDSLPMHGLPFTVLKICCLRGGVRLSSPACLLFAPHSKVGSLRCYWLGQLHSKMRLIAQVSAIEDCMARWMRSGALPSRRECSSWWSSFDWKSLKQFGLCRWDRSADPRRLSQDRDPLRTGEVIWLN